MTKLSSILSPIDRSMHRRTAIEVYDRLQIDILRGALKPGSIVSQVAIAQALNVSRTPVREAFRMLQEAGLLVGEPNQRCRVVGFDPADVEALYAKRIVLEALGAAMTAKGLDSAGRAQLDGIVLALEGEQAHEDFDVWQQLHRQFHRTIVSAAGVILTNDLEQLERRSERYQSAYKGAHLPGWWLRGEAEHRELSNAIIAGQPGAAGELAARHLARTALELLAAMAPEFETGALRNALRFAIEGARAI
jgi:DNA-binding GntR family transcriptional regulator